MVSAYGCLCTLALAKLVLLQSLTPPAVDLFGRFGQSNVAQTLTCHTQLMHLAGMAAMCCRWTQHSSPHVTYQKQTPHHTHYNVQELFGANVTYSVETGDLTRLVDTPLDTVAAGARLGDRARALLAARRDKRPLWPLCFTVVQGSHLEGYFAPHFVEDRVPPAAPAYHEFLMHLHKGISLR